MRALIIGAAGFVGGHLAKYLVIDLKWQVWVTTLPGEKIEEGYENCYELDILDHQSIDEVIDEVNPNIIFHLAAQSSVALSWKNPGLTIDVNIKGSLALLESVKKTGKPIKVLLIGSGEEYGYIRPEELPLDEEASLRPGNIYAVTKAAQGMLGQVYAKAYHLDLVMVRAFNHIGPGQGQGFVVSDFCKQVADIEKGRKEPRILVGNLSARRDFTDVRDVVEAYSLLGQYGRSGEVYNVGSGNAISIEDILQQILSLAAVPISVEADSSRLRPSDIPVIQANIQKICRDTGWFPKRKLRDTLLDTLDYWRKAQ